MRKYEAPSIDFYVFEMPESIMGSNECGGYDVPTCPTFGMCISDTPGCPAYFECTTDGMCISDGVCIVVASGV